MSSVGDWVERTFAPEALATPSASREKSKRSEMKSEIAAGDKKTRETVLAEIAKQDEKRDKKAAQLNTLQQRTSYGSNERNLSRSFLLRL